MIRITFTGTQLSLLYTGLTNRGTMQVYIDGELVGTINQYSLGVTWQNRWDSAPVTPGLHTVQLVHASGAINDLDAILVDGVNPFPAGTHDDTDSRIHFGGTWTPYSHASAHDGGSRYSETIGNTVSFHFTGTQLSLLYTGLTNRGTMQVYIDGSLVDTINQYSSTLTWKKNWDSPALSPGQHKVRLVHASGAINDLDAIIVTDSTATATPTATPTATVTGTLTVSVTPGTTPIPTETPPPPLQSAEYFYDGDGNMVKAVVNDVVTYYPGRHYNEEVDNSVSTVKKFYTLGSTTVAVRTITDTENTLNWILGDHLGSTSVTANADGSWNSEIKYTAFGEVRTSNGLTPTEYRYTGQMEAAELGLYFYVARWYDPYLNHFIQADTLVPGAGNAKAYDRYAYAEWNSILYTDPSGHMIMVEDNLFIRDDRKTGDFVFINDVGAGKLFANPVEQAAANVILNENPKYFDAMPSNCNGIPIGAAFENAGGKIGVDLGSYYTTFINLMNMVLIGIAGSRYPGSDTSSTTPKAVLNDALGDPDCVGCGYTRTPRNPNDILMPNGEPIGTQGMRDPKIRTVENENAIWKIFQDLSVNAQPITRPSYDGQWYKLPLGGELGIRNTSRSGGLALDIVIPGIPIDKIHLPLIK